MVNILVTILIQVYARWYYYKKGYILKLVSDAKNELIVSSEIIKFDSKTSKKANCRVANFIVNCKK